VADLIAKESKEHWLWCNVYTVCIAIVSNIFWITKNSSSHIDIL